MDEVERGESEATRLGLGIEIGESQFLKRAGS